MAEVSTHGVGAVLVARIDNPPLNALSAAIRRGLADAIAAAQTDATVEAVIILGAGKAFSAGADITEFGKPPLEPSLPDLVNAIEQSAKPVVAALHGTVLGGGLEIALGCHYRLAAPSAKLGLPEVKLGLLPGAGGTQRLPRIIGVEQALTMIVTGESVSAERARDLNLVDATVGEQTLEADAIVFAAQIAKQSTHPVSSARKDQVRDVSSNVFAQFREKNARLLKGLEAPEACITAVEAAVTLPFTEGAAKERALFRSLVAGAQSKALRHVFFAERAAAKIDGVSAATPLVDVKTVGVLGAGTMGAGIATNFLIIGMPVTLVEREQAALDRGVGAIRKNLEAAVRKGRMTEQAAQASLALLRPSIKIADLAACDLIIEAVFELMEVKKGVFRQLDEIVKPGAILASNTSYLDIDVLAGETKRPEWVIGLHFFSPANLMKLLEIVRGAQTSPSVLATCMALARKIGKVAVIAGVCYGFIGNRMLQQRQREASALLLEGATPAQIDRVLLDFGFPMGPFQMSDLAGLDIGWDPAASRSATIREVLCERGRRGQKTGKGFYDYDERRNRAPSPEVDAIIAEFARASGKPQREIGDEEIKERLLYPMVNEGALILAERIAQRASDIDVVWINGYGWPTWTGGPMFWADTVGLDQVVAGLMRHASRMDGFALAPLLKDKAERGERFN